MNMNISKTYPSVMLQWSTVARLEAHRWPDTVLVVCSDLGRASTFLGGTDPRIKPSPAKQQLHALNEFFFSLYCSTAYSLLQPVV